jgi:hypothetical protein
VDSEQVTVSVVHDFHAPLRPALERSLQVAHHLAARHCGLIPRLRIISQDDPLIVEGKRAMADVEEIPGHATSKVVHRREQVRFRRVPMRWCHGQKPAK